MALLLSNTARILAGGVCAIAAGGKVSGAVAWGGYTKDYDSQGKSLTAECERDLLRADFGRRGGDFGLLHAVLRMAHLLDHFRDEYQVPFIGDPVRRPNSCAAQSKAPNGNPGADSMASIIAHELEETVTDPSTRGTTSNGSYANMSLGGLNYLIQENRVNAGSGYCAAEVLTAAIRGHRRSRIRGRR